MATITIRLDPGALANPDADLRYVLPEMLETESDGLVRDDAYDYDDDDTMIIYLRTDDAEGGFAFVNAFLRSTPVMGNDLAGAVVERVG